MTKKFLIFVAILAVAAILWAENQTISCESKYGTCSLELSDEALSQNCVCRDGREFGLSDPVIEGFNDGPLTEKWCQTTIDDMCKKIPAQCNKVIFRRDDEYCLSVVSAEKDSVEDFARDEDRDKGVNGERKVFEGDDADRNYQ